MTFKVCNYGSKYPYLLHKMGFVDSQFGTTVHTFWPTVLTFQEQVHYNMHKFDRQYNPDKSHVQNVDHIGM